MDSSNAEGRLTMREVYKVSRYDASTDIEVLIDRAELLLAPDGALWTRVDGGTLTRCEGNDVAAAIGADPMLSDVRANQVTRISAEPEALHELPLVLRMPGHGADFDASQWSAAMLDLHWLISPERDMYRVLYVNGVHWGAFTTTVRERMLPDDWGYLPRFEPLWAHMSWINPESRTSGYDHSYIGLVTPGVVVLATPLDEGFGTPIEVMPRRQGDAAVFVTWLLQGGVRYYLDASIDEPDDEGEDLVLVRLFAEAIAHTTEVFFTGGELAAGTVADDLINVAFDWTMELNLDPVMIDSILDELAQRGPRYLAIVTAARDPGSPDGLALRAALDRWERENPA